MTTTSISDRIALHVYSPTLYQQGPKLLQQLPKSLPEEHSTSSATGALPTSPAAVGCACVAPLPPAFLTHPLIPDFFFYIPFLSILTITNRNFVLHQFECHVNCLSMFIDKSQILSNLVVSVSSMQRSHPLSKGSTSAKSPV